MSLYHLENSTQEMENAVNAFLSLDFEEITLRKAKIVVKKFRNFPETLFKIVEHIINSKRLPNEECIELIEYIDSVKEETKELKGLNILLNSRLLLNKINLYDNESCFDRVIHTFKKYNFIILSEEKNKEGQYNLNSTEYKEPLIVLYFRALTKSHKYRNIIQIYENFIDDNKRKYNFNQIEGNRFFNYLARAYSHQANSQEEVETNLKKAERFGNTEEENIIRNYRYKTLIYWRLKPSKTYHIKCKENAENGIKYLNAENRKEKYKKYFSDINRMLAALYLDANNLSELKILKEAKKYNQQAWDILKEQDYHYQRFWLNFQRCNFLRLEKEYDKAFKLLNELKTNKIYNHTLENHPEPKYKLMEEKCKLLLSKGIDYISDLKSLLDNDFYQYSKDNVFYEFKRLIFKTQALITENENKDMALEYYHTVKIINLERKLQNDGKRYRELITIFEPSNEK